MAKLLDRLRQLYQVAILRPEEEGDDARANEARNAAFLLLKLAREGGVKVRFEQVREERPPPKPAPSPSRPYTGVDFGVDFTTTFDAFNRVEEEMRRRERAEGTQSFDEKVRAAQSAFGAPQLVHIRLQSVCVQCGRRLVSGDRAWRAESPGAPVVCVLCGPSRVEAWARKAGAKQP
jgi:hypothetical protein